MCENILIMVLLTYLSMKYIYLTVMRLQKPSFCLIFEVKMFNEVGDFSR